MNSEKYFIFDESGNLGSTGRYFVIACVETTNYKTLNHVMKRKLGKAKNIFPDLATLHSHEIKAKDAYPCIKYHIAETLAKKDIKISYIVADLSHIKPTLLKEKNIFYNYLMRLLLDYLLSSKDNGKTINIIYDNHTTKVGSVNSLNEYLQLHFIYEKGYDINFTFQSKDSDAADAYSVQAADYVANSVYSFYEYNLSLYYDLYKPILHHKIIFPPAKFGK
ncbi:hypothetical protein SAMN04487829_1904 [Pseudobutyrivibrio sp. NOR37]|uniref:DUF3800 domain-containing protein n=1 Tax=Pseudobutyrivibrio xylanivorans TaxID=185007 RepID=A0A6M0LIH2_PSEXY|nr:MULTISPECIES: DUF3800 domain-containing protein [Pseudobutyrivibrio]NEX02282.1 DUF3800 domain-containing protein [Pseudobutyrivibrio xylanivorans]SFR77710.1 hypothetical protein SAMN04487829_1904 [Pseudobutyrivibrio sp. NOR37]